MEVEKKKKKEKNKKKKKRRSKGFRNITNVSKYHYTLKKSMRTKKNFKKIIFFLLKKGFHG